MAALILKLGSRWRWVVIFTLRPLYHREVRPDTHGVGHRGGHDPLEKTNMVRLLSYPLSSACLSVCIYFVPLLSCVPCIISANISSVCFLFLPHSFILHFLLLSLLPHFLHKFISTPFPVLPWQSRLLILHIVTRGVWNNSVLALGLGRSFRLETHTKTVPECDRYCSMTPTL